MLRFPRRGGALGTLLLAASLVWWPAPGHAHDSATPEQPHDHIGATSGTWQWTPDANVFFGLNYQNRKFTDFTAWESQNWVMLAGERPLGEGRLEVSGMLSFETFTLKALGSPQVFQTGETYHGGPLIDYLGFRHFHPISRVVAGTVGYIRELPLTRWGRTGVGADITVYRVSDDLLLPYGSPCSFHVFMRWRPRPRPRTSTDRIVLGSSFVVRRSAVRRSSFGRSAFGVRRLFVLYRGSAIPNS